MYFVRRKEDRLSDLEGERMETFLDYLKVFAVGGGLCAVGQLLINKTGMSSARILVLFMLLGLVMELVGAFSYIKGFASSGVTVPITGFGSNLAKGAMQGAKEGGVLGAVGGGLKAAAPGISAVILFGFLFALIFRSKSKKI